MRFNFYKNFLATRRTIPCPNLISGEKLGIPKKEVNLTVDCFADIHEVAKEREARNGSGKACTNALFRLALNLTERDGHRVQLAQIGDGGGKDARQTTLMGAVRIDIDKDQMKESFDTIYHPYQVEIMDFMNECCANTDPSWNIPTTGYMPGNCFCIA